ncbi:MAG: helix-turn-helix domain-containing protein [Fimbriimonadaceae bacterium]|nr:helix-turn-helix domain-containing protein [Fimbriimonadaceae bacterium]
MPSKAKPGWSTTAQVCAAGGVSAPTAFRWSQQGVLPPYVHGGKRGLTARWPLHTPDQAAWVRVQLDAGLTFAEIVTLLEAGVFRPSSCEDDSKDDISGR